MREQGEREVNDVHTMHNNNITIYLVFEASFLVGLTNSNAPEDESSLLAVGEATSELGLFVVTDIFSPAI